MDKQKTEQIREEFKQLESPNARLIDKQMEISSQISRYLQQQGLTQKELAQKADIGESQLSEIMRGEGNPTLKTLVKLEEALGQDIIVAPFFHEEKIRKKGFMHIPAKQSEQFIMGIHGEPMGEVSTRLVSDLDQGNITYEENYESESEQREKLPLAS